MPSIGAVQLEDVNSLDFQQISFSFGAKQIINLNHHMDKGRVYWIKGENGSGKTTFINLFLGLFANDYHGIILVNGIDMSQIDIPSFLTNHVTVVEQNPYILPTDYEIIRF
ncbi:MAG: ATP-binding cassette domain-containing protein [Oscillospiraceae bacterium]|nr:ATP-binding cassette domain-containing protein [Oscillospiraceae bacterium]